MGGVSCNVCHYPEAFDIPDIESPDIPLPVGLAISAEERAFLLASNAPVVIYDVQLERKETLAIFPCFVCFKGN
jgi:hypothetical protein